MIGEYTFFQDFFDGQIVKKESENFRLFKLFLFSFVSAIGLFLVFMNIINLLEFSLLEIGMFWNFYSRLDSKLSMLCCFVVSCLYCVICLNFDLYANAVVYLGCYVPIQLMAMTKDYQEGDFIQIKKMLNIYNKIILFMCLCASVVVFFLIDVSCGTKFALLDGFVAGFLFVSALLRNERYFEYYVFRFLALISSLVMWSIMYIEFGYIGIVAILILYSTYLIYDLASFVYQKKTYKNEYMVQVELMNEEIEKNYIESKVKAYNRLKNNKNKNREL